MSRTTSVALPRTLWRRFRVAVLAAVVGVGVVACGSDTDSGGSSKNSIVIGTVGAYSGAIAFTANGVKRGLEAWVEATNAKGGINGRKIELKVADDQGQATAALTATKRLVEQDKVVAIVGQSGADQAIAPYLAQKGVPVIGGQSVGLPYITNANFFAAGANVISLTYGAQAEAKKIGTNFGFVYCAEVPICKQASALQGALSKVSGVKVGPSLAVSASAPDYTAQCQSLKSSNVQSYFPGVAAPVALRFAAACEQQGLNAKVVANASAMGGSWLKNKAVDGALASDSNVPFAVTDTPAMKEFHAAIDKYAPNLGESEGPNVVYGWVAGKLFEAAVKGAGSKDITSSSLKDGLYSLKGETLGGMAPPLTYAKGKPTLINCYFVTGVEGGKFTAPEGSKTACAPDKLISSIAASFK